LDEGSWLIRLPQFLEADSADAIDAFIESFYRKARL